MNHIGDIFLATENKIVQRSKAVVIKTSGANSYVFRLRNLKMHLDKNLFLYKKNHSSVGNFSEVNY